MTLQAVILDFDGVICETVEYHYRSWKRLSEKYGIPFTRQENNKLRGLTRRKSLEVILGDRKFPEDEIKKMLRLKNEFYLELINDMTEADLMPGVKSLLDQLREAGIKIGVASASRNAKIVLEHMGIDSYMSSISDGNIVQKSKPAPDVYLHAAKTMDVLPKACVAIEDSEAGVESASQAGMCVIGLGPPQRVGKAQAVFPDLKQVSLENLRIIHKWWQASQTTSPGTRLKEYLSR